MGGLYRPDEHVVRPRRSDARRAPYGLSFLIAHQEAVMNRPTWLAAIVVLLAPACVLAQPGMQGGGMRGGGMGGMMGGGMGGMGMGGGMGGMGGMMGGMGGGTAAAVARPVQLGIEGGRRLNGKIGLGF